MHCSFRERARRALAALAGASAILIITSSPSSAQANWASGVRNNDDTLQFAGWRGTTLRVVTGWIDWKQGWAGMNANGAGDAEIRLGWEASGDWFPWSAAGKPAAQWKSCFTHVARAMKSAAPNLRIGWYMAKKGRIDVRTIYPDEAPITYIGISHYDDGEARFGSETYQGGPWGLREFLRFARSKGKKFAIGEWGVGRRGDNPDYIRSMHAFFREAGSDLAHEAYFNAKEHRLFPNGLNPRSAEAYRQLF
jgi:hypothetical protein